MAHALHTDSEAVGVLLYWSIYCCYWTDKLLTLLSVQCRPCCADKLSLHLAYHPKTSNLVNAKDIA